MQILCHIHPVPIGHRRYLPPPPHCTLISSIFFPRLPEVSSLSAIRCSDYQTFFTIFSRSIPLELDSRPATRQKYRTFHLPIHTRGRNALDSDPMMGRRDDGAPRVTSTNVFAALDSLRKKKKDPRGKSSSNPAQAKRVEPELVWAPTPLAAKSWADVDDEEDDDYYATAAPMPNAWGVQQAKQIEEIEVVLEEETESDVGDSDGGDEGSDDEPEIPATHATPPEKKHVAALAAKEPERQLSKKEQKKKELAELEAILSEFGLDINNTVNRSDALQGERKIERSNGDFRKENVSAPAVGKTSKKKKKKDKSSKEGKDSQEQLDGSHINLNEATEAMPVEEDASAVDVKERLKKVASMKKKKSSKEMDAAAKAAAIEAAARNAKLAAAKKKEKSHYNQQPLR